MFTRVLGRAGAHPDGRGKGPITDVADVGLKECVHTNGKWDIELLAVSLPLAQPSLFYLPHLPELLLPDVEQLVLGSPGQCHW